MFKNLRVISLEYSEKSWRSSNAMSKINETLKGYYDENPNSEKIMEKGNLHVKDEFCKICQLGSWLKAS